MITNLKITGNYKYAESGIPTRMIVVADGDVIRNDVRQTAQGTMISPLGFDRYTSQTYGNKEFIVNAVNYLTDETGLMSLRSREVKLRLLDRNKINNERGRWQRINSILPALLVILAGMMVISYRKKLYGGK